jgi:hypothetical protein
MAKFQTNQISLTSDDLNFTQHYDPKFVGDVHQKTQDTIINKAIYQVLKFGSLKNKWLPEDKSFDLPEKNSQEYNDTISNIRSFLKNTPPGAKFVQQYINEVEDINGVVEYVNYKAIVIFESNQVYNYLIENYSSLFSDVPLGPPALDETPIQDIEIFSTGDASHQVELSNADGFLAFRSLPCNKSLPAPDIYDENKKGALSDKFPTAAGSLGGLVGLLPHGTKVISQNIGIGFAGTWSEVTVVSGPENLDNSLLGQTAFVDNQMLSSIKEPGIVLTADMDPETLDLVAKALNPPLIETSTDEARPLNPGIASSAPRQDWSRRTPLKVVKNTELQRYEITVELDYYPYESTSDLANDPEARKSAILEYKRAKKIEARKSGLKELLKYFSRRHDDAYITALLFSGSGEMGRLTGPWADDNPNNRKIYFQVEVPYTGAGGFNYKSHEPAERLTIKEMIKERVVEFQYAFSTNKIEDDIKKIIKILDEFRYWIDNYNGSVDNSPDMEYQIKRMEEVIPAIKELLSDNNIKYRTDKEDLIELGMNSDLKIIYVRFAPEDGRDGDWRIK